MILVVDYKCNWLEKTSPFKQVHNPLDVLKIIDAEKLQGSWMPRNSNTTTMEGCAPKTLVQGTVLQVLIKLPSRKTQLTRLLWTT